MVSIAFAMRWQCVRIGVFPAFTGCLFGLVGFPAKVCNLLLYPELPIYTVIMQNEKLPQYVRYAFAVRSHTNQSGDFFDGWR